MKIEEEHWEEEDKGEVEEEEVREEFCWHRSGGLKRRSSEREGGREWGS